MKKIIGIGVVLLYLFSFQLVHAQFGRYPSDKTVQNGRILDQVNQIEIPLTASENFIRGQVKSVSFRDYEIAEGSGKVLADTGMNEYSRDGFLIKQNIYRLDGRLTLQCDYNYEKKRLLCWNLKSSGINNEDAKTMFDYDDSGRKTVQRIISNDPAKPTGMPYPKMTFKYDNKENEIEEDDYRDDGKLAKIETSIYDDRGNQVDYTENTPDGKPQSRYTLEYDKNGYKIAGSVSDLQIGSFSKWTAKNDDKGRLVQKTGYKADGKVAETVVYKYDVMDNEIKRITYNPDGTLDTAQGYAAYEYEYEYDNHGNIAKYTEYKTEAGKRTPTRSSEMEYIYY